MTDPHVQSVVVPAVGARAPASPAAFSAVATAGLSLDPAPADGLVRIEIWDAVEPVAARSADALGPLPAFGRAVMAGSRRILGWEPQTWLVRAPGEAAEALAAALTERFAGVGAATDVSGAWRRIRVGGARWRELMMLGGVFDAEAVDFGPGCVVGTLLHHLPVRLDAVDADIVDAYVPPSYAADLLHHWRAVQRRFAAGEDAS